MWEELALLLSSSSLSRLCLGTNTCVGRARLVTLVLFLVMSATIIICTVREYGLYTYSCIASLHIVVNGFCRAPRGQCGHREVAGNGRPERRLGHASTGQGVERVLRQHDLGGQGQGQGTTMPLELIRGPTGVRAAGGARVRRAKTVQDGNGAGGNSRAATGTGGAVARDTNGNMPATATGKSSAFKATRNRAAEETGETTGNGGSEAVGGVLSIIVSILQRSLATANFGYTYVRP